MSRRGEHAIHARTVSSHDTFCMAKSSTEPDQGMLAVSTKGAPFFPLTALVLFFFSASTVLRSEGGASVLVAISHPDSHDTNDYFHAGSTNCYKNSSGDVYDCVHKDLHVS